MYGRLHSDICNVPLFLLNGVKIQIKLTKAKKAFYLLSNRADTKATFKFQEILFYVKRILPALFSYHITKIYWQATRPDITLPGSNSGLSHFLAGRNPLPSTPPFWGPIEAFVIHHGEEHGLSRLRRLESLQIQTLRFRTFCHVRRRQADPVRRPVSNEKTSVTGYRTLFEGSGIHHSNSGLQITPAMYINGFSC